MKNKLLLICLSLFTTILPMYAQKIKEEGYKEKLSIHKPVVRNASSEVRNLLNYLYSISGNQCLSGQHDFNNLGCSKEVHEITGKYPAILGIEMNVYVTDKIGAFKVRDSLMQKAIQYWNDGGIITISWHESKPGSPVQDFAHSQAKCTQEEFNEFVKPGTNGYKLLIDDIDQVAVQLEKLKKAHVPVLWRPYHEMNGGWFWWGKKSNFTTLWNIMYERFTKHHRLNNLIWVYGPNVPINKDIGPYEDYYPGPSKVDILGTDAYPKANNQFIVEWHDQIVKLSAGRPVAQTECGVLPTGVQFSGMYNKYIWFLTWRGYLRKSNTIEQIKALYSDPRIITRDEVPDLRN